jgi:hypothetical protein
MARTKTLNDTNRANKKALRTCRVADASVEVSDSQLHGRTELSLAQLRDEILDYGLKSEEGVKLRGIMFDMESKVVTLQINLLP